jgi:hypothetical protein
MSTLALRETAAVSRRAGLSQTLMDHKPESRTINLPACGRDGGRRQEPRAVPLGLADSSPRLIPAQLHDPAHSSLRCGRTCAGSVVQYGSHDEPELAMIPAAADRTIPA